MIPRVEELNHLLAVIALLNGVDSDVPIDFVIEQCRGHVYGGLLPDHQETLEFATSLGLLASTESRTQITEAGRAFLSLNVENTYELTEDQVRYLVRKHYFDGALKVVCHKLFDAFSLAHEKGLYKWSELNGPELFAPSWLIAHLCQFGVLERLEGGLQSSLAYAELVNTFVDEAAGMSLEHLKQLLKEKDDVGQVAEHLVLKFEEDRLNEIQCNVEANCVRQISSIRVNAGYDIESFDAASDAMVFDRFIEVKGSRGKELRFFWTENELNVARRLGKRYWIYFQGGIDLATGNSKLQPVLIQDPTKSIFENEQIHVMSHGIFVHGPSIKGQIK